MNTNKPCLTVVIPALNEEEAIGGTISRCLAASAEICEAGGISEVEIIVVSDGSTDRTVEIAHDLADRNPQVKLIVFDHNRGYGAAIKEGFNSGKGDLLAFVDADGTCDPRFFGELCSAMRGEEADIALGSRMGPGSHMPRVRRLGNRIFALVLGFLSGEAVTDTASGMRVIRRQALAKLYPLPDGLHFTPAMSARAVMQRLRIIELPMAYSERVGVSKLRAVTDGLRFLRAIVDAVLFYRPARVFTLCFSLCALGVLLLAISPAEFYLRNHYFEEWMIYRFVVGLLLGAIGFTLLCAAVIADELFELTNKRRRWNSFGSQLLYQVFSKASLLTISALSVLVSVVLVWPGVVEYFTTRHVTLHWSRVIVAAFGFLIATECVVTASLLRIVGLWKDFLASSQKSIEVAAEHKVEAATPLEEARHS
ncbi:MAG: glycosyltransferase family 2 protein [Acidobacteriota bacterium]